MPESDNRTGDSDCGFEAPAGSHQIAPTWAAPRASGFRLLAAALTVVFIAESLVMFFVMPGLTSSDLDPRGAVIDSVLMSLISAPLLWWFITLHERTAQALKRSSEDLQLANAELEKERREISAFNRTLEDKVAERTRDLELANAELRERNRQVLRARAQAATDALTSLPNHRAFHQKIRQVVAAAQKAGERVGLIMLDIDGFKDVNDSLGHLQGDDILRQCAAVFCAVVRRESVYRYGGDEFAVILEGADEERAADVAEQLRHAIAARRSEDPNNVTISLGVASFPETTRSAEELIYEADAAMYWAKAAGKNRVGRWGTVVNASRNSLTAYPGGQR